MASTVSTKQRVPTSRHLVIFDEHMKDVFISNKVWYLPSDMSKVGSTLMHETILGATVGQVVVNQTLGVNESKSSASDILKIADEFFEPQPYASNPSKDVIHFVIGFDEIIFMQDQRLRMDTLVLYAIRFLKELQPVLQSNRTIVWSSLLSLNYVPCYAAEMAIFMQNLYERTRNLIVRNYAHDPPARTNRRYRPQWTPKYRCEVGKRVLDAIAADLPSRSVGSMKLYERTGPITTVRVNERRQVVAIEQIPESSDGDSESILTPMDDFVTGTYQPSWLTYPNPFEHVERIRINPTEPQGTGDEEQPLDLTIKDPLAPGCVSASPQSSPDIEIILTDEDEEIKYEIVQAESAPLGSPSVENNLEALNEPCPEWEVMMSEPPSLLSIDKYIFDCSDEDI